MNEFIVIDTENITHWVQTCLTCRALVERDQMEAHIRYCTRVMYVTSPHVTGIKA